MNAIKYIENKLTFTRQPLPIPSPHQVLVKVVAFGINRTDIQQLAAPMDIAPGVEFSGVIHTTGSLVAGFTSGDQVCGFVYYGAYAEYVACSPTHLIKLRPAISLIEAAAIPMSWFSCLDALKYAGTFKKRDKVLVHIGKCSDLGLAFVQLAQTIGCRRVFAVCPNAETAAFIQKHLVFAESLPDEVVAINITTQNWVKVVQKYDPRGIQLVVSEVQGLFDENVSVLGFGGTVVYQTPTTRVDGDLTGALNKHIKVHSVNIRSQSPAHIDELCGFTKERIMDRFENRKLQVCIDQVMDWKQIERAHDVFDNSVGKIVCRVGTEPRENRKAQVGSFA